MDKMNAKLKFTNRTKLMLAYCFSMLGLTLLNILLNVIPNNLSENSLNIMFSLISQIGCMGIIPFFFAVIFTKKKDKSFAQAGKELFVSYGYTKKLPSKAWLLMIPLAISMCLVTQLLSTISALFLVAVGFQMPVSAGTIYKGPLDLVKWIVLSALLPAIFEEFTHRGVALTALKERGSEMTQVVLSGLLFALMHTNIMQSFYAFVGGCIFGYITVRSGSMYPAMILHFTNNAVSCLQSYAMQYPNSALGFINTINDFWATNIFTMLLRGVVLVANLFLFIFLLSCFLKFVDKRTPVKGIRIPKTNIDIDLYHPDGKAMLTDNFIMYGTIAMLSLSTLFSLVWGIIR